VRFPESLTVRDFLGGYWQKRPLNMPAALTSRYPSLTADEMAWLATLPDVESRLVFTDREGDKFAYRVEYGPFTESRLSSLPARDWSLLVQDVEKHLPDFRQYLDAVNFIPDWRVDDLMISVAAPGGSVGPHRDNYDVFLCQGHGVRNWRLANMETVEIDTESHELSLLKPFRGDQILTAAEGDVLYLPPGLPHWGVAETQCSTYSIGMRAPNMAELRAGCDRLFPEFEDADASIAEAETLRFYCDPDFHDEEAVRGKISTTAIDAVRKQELLPGYLTNEQIAVVLGSVVTDPKAWLAPDGMEKAAAKRYLDNPALDQDLAVHGMARLAFFETDNAAFVFVNGYEREVSATQCTWFRQVCAWRNVDSDDVNAARSDPELGSLLEWMLTNGGLDSV